MGTHTHTHTHIHAHTLGWLSGGWQVAIRKEVLHLSVRMRVDHRSQKVSTELGIVPRPSTSTRLQGLVACTRLRDSGPLRFQSLPQLPEALAECLPHAPLARMQPRALRGQIFELRQVVSLRQVESLAGSSVVPTSPAVVVAVAPVSGTVLVEPLRSTQTHIHTYTHTHTGG